MSAITWDKITLLCANHPDDPEMVMELQEITPGKPPIYACPHYSPIPGNASGTLCKNRFTIQEMEKLIGKIDSLSSDPESPDRMNLTGYRWTEKGIDYEVLSMNKNGIKISVLNRKLLSQ